MAYKFQLNDAQNSVALKSISGACPTSSAFVSLVNEAQRRLLRRGDFYGTVWAMALCFQGSIIAWPREVGTVIGVRKSRGHFQVQNQWYSFTGCWRGHHDNWHSDVTFEDLNPSPVSNQIYGRQNVPLSSLYNAPSFPSTPPANGMLIRYYVTRPEDIGKTITLFGHQYGGQPLQTVSASNVASDGLVLTAANPYASTSIYVTDIKSVVRQATTGVAYLYQYDPTANVLIDLAVYQPGDTNPMFRRSLVRNCAMRFCNQSDAITPQFNSVEALVKLEFIPVVNPSDFLVIDSFDAIKFMIQAIRAEEAGDNQTAEIFIGKAIREMNFEDRAKQPDNHTPVMVNTQFGSRIVSPW